MGRMMRKQGKRNYCSHTTNADNRRDSADNRRDSANNRRDSADNPFKSADNPVILIQLSFSTRFRSVFQ
jgi:hypothetical protein